MASTNSLLKKLVSPVINTDLLLNIIMKIFIRLYIPTDKDYLPYSETQ